MNSFKDIIERCHQRHEKPLRQRKTVVTHWMYNKDYPHQYTIYCAHKYPVKLADLEQANISFMPIGQASRHNLDPGIPSGKRQPLKRQGMEYRKIKKWGESWGIQMCTGIPSERDGTRWHDIEFKYEIISAASDHVCACIKALANAVVNPLLTISESGGLRFSCRIPDYLHPNTEEARLYIYKGTPMEENPNQGDVYLEILGEDGWSYWDARYEILLGNLLDPPTIDKDILFAHIDTLRTLLHEPAPPREQQLRPTPQTNTVAPHSLNSQNLNLAKDAFEKRGFSYIREDDGFHRWTRPGGAMGNVHVLLWENESVVWIWAFTSRCWTAHGSYTYNRCLGRYRNPALDPDEYTAHIRQGTRSTGRETQPVRHKTSVSYTA